jgi:hypothetical protein
MECGHILVVALDGRPLANSQRMLLQVMSEEKESGRKIESAGSGVNRLASIGTDPWLVREMEGTLRFKRPDAARLTVTALDFNGYPQGSPVGNAASFQLQAKTLYYLIAN